MFAPNKLTLIAAALYGSTCPVIAFSKAPSDESAAFIKVAEALLAYTHGSDLHNANHVQLGEYTNAVLKTADIENLNPAQAVCIFLSVASTLV